MELALRIPYLIVECCQGNEGAKGMPFCIVMKNKMLVSELASNSKGLLGGWAKSCLVGKFWLTFPINQLIKKESKTR
ncbi:hypothetical protein [Enterovibrio paralichthyis]|uniref:hypothetical protein n=1 Tax=Enterovibrio paralichthyis TaxID=2853805 RepID=UPI001C46176D|nr:hypothetical protein [Enterovibrio paralichthyis]MBV7298187.1 hypothetical protein [Enterovibrio paralichthyis]